MRKLLITLTILMMFALLASFATAGAVNPNRNGGRACTRGRASWCATATPIVTATPQYSRIIVTPKCLQIIGIDCP